MTWDEGSMIKPRASSLRVTINVASLPEGAADLAKNCIFYLELLIMFEQNAGHRLLFHRILVQN